MDHGQANEQSVATREDFDAASVLASLSGHSPTNVLFPRTDGFAPLSSMPILKEEHQQTSGLESVAAEVTGDGIDAIKLHELPGPQPDTEDLLPPVDQDTVAAIAALTNEHGMRVRKPVSRPADFIETPELDAPEMSTKTASKKRAAPTEAKKPVTKKRKSEVPSDRNTPTHDRTVSPSPSVVPAKHTKSSQAKKPKNAKARPTSPKLTSDGPTARAYSPDPEDSEVSNPDELFCICRKPDNHKFMLACDGCDDWFHGKCVSIHKEDSILIDKFKCPLCVEKGKGVTTWKPMCRREGCRNPAILKKGQESKYCSKRCGLDFMKSNLKRSTSQRDETESRPVKRQKSAKSTRAIEDEEAADDDTLGGVIGPAHLKALTDSATDSETFRQLGAEAFPTPPPTAKREEPEFTEAETQRLSEIEARKDLLYQQRILYKDRETFLSMMKARIQTMKEKLELKADQVPCGFDPIWALDDISFKEWRDSEEGRKAFDTGSLKIPDTLDEEERGICTRSSKKRCAQHGSWHPLLLRDLRFESGEIGKDMRRIDAEEKEIHAHAITRARSRAFENQQAAEGWVEHVDDVDDKDLSKPQSEQQQNIPAVDDDDVGATPLAQEEAAAVKMEGDVRPAYMPAPQSPEENAMDIGA